VTIADGDTLRVTIVLDESAQRLGAIRVVALRGDLTPEQRVDRERIAASVPHDAGDVLRELPGTDAMRRGALGLDPVVRGLRDTQLGVYVDAARTFPGGPAGMDTPLSHVDPAHVQSMEVITGPYALTWGAGNLSAIRVTANALPGADAAPFGARLTSGYDANLRATELAGTVQRAVGTDGRLRYTTGGTWREGNDYRAGDGTTIPGSFRSAEMRARVGVRTGTNGVLSVLGAKQEQRGIDYPGRPLDAVYFDSYHVQAEWALRRPASDGARTVAGLALRDVDLMAYEYDVGHLMGNDRKPTALPNPDRMPPFPLVINTWSGVHVHGGRAPARLVAPSGWELQVGAFGRRLDDYITIEATDLPRRQAGSPPPVFRFVNGRADYYGGEVVAATPVTDALTLSGSVAYLHGQDVTLDEPALGVTPLRADLRARYAPVRGRWFVETSAHLAGEQGRVATTRGEKATAGWTTVDLQGGIQLPSAGSRELSLRVGARNLFDRAYVQHLTALDAFTAGRIAEPGRVLFARVTMAM
jgi:outer membrane cobalamin receptor